MEKIRTWLVAIAMLASAISVAQKSETLKVKFGDISKSDFESTTDSTEAVMLMDKGITVFNYNKTKGDFQLEFTRHTRIKINNTNGYDWADIEIPLYGDGGLKERAVSIKGFTHVLEGGKVKKIKLEKGSIFREEDNEYWSTTKFTLPEVSEGVIIEYTYKVISDFYYNLKAWTFQHSIPVKWSEYEVRIPEYYRYRKLTSGFIPVYINETSSGSNSITFMNVSNNRANASQATRASSSTTTYQEFNERFVMKDVPAFVAEPYLNARKNYISRIEFELASVAFPGSTPRNYAESWQSLNKKLVENPNFWVVTKRADFLKDELAILRAQYEDDSKYILAINRLIKSKVQWNEIYSIYATPPLRSIFSKGRGDTADINLMLVAALKEAGFQAFPVLVSRRSNGVIREQFPLLKYFNYVIAAVEMDGKRYFLDAVNRAMPEGYLPRELFNGKGLLVKESGPTLIEISPNAQIAYNTMSSLKLDSEGKLSGDVVFNSTNYGSFGRKSRFKNEGEEEYVKKWQDNHDEWAVTSITVENTDDMTKPLIEKVAVESLDVVETAGNLAYIKPLLTETLDENPFKLENRMYPVDFNIPFKDQFVLTLMLDPAWTVEELPEPLAIGLPEKAGMFRYNVVNTGNMIQVQCVVQINKQIFVQGEYSSLREFFSQIVAKQAQPIVLKKN